MRLLAVVFFLLLANAAIAQVRPIYDDAEARLWQAVGVVVVNRQPICTGTLIAPDLVLTAAHCVYSGNSRNLLDPGLVEFRAGWRNGVSAARRQASRITAHRNFDPSVNYRKLTPQAERNIAFDLAIISLDRPVRAEQVAPMTLLNRIRDGDRYDLVSYGQGRMDYPSIQQGCRLLGSRSRMLRLDCSAAPGMSGAPVFGYLLGRPQIVSLISQMLERNGGEQTVLGIALGKTLLRLMRDREALNGLFVQNPPFWDTGRPLRPATPVPVPERRIVRPGGALNLPQN